MILYSKSGEFLGIGKEELSFLGYEDLEDFKSINDDVADLFVNKPGYIFKFKNFSWIDYALHSGAPKKSVVLQLKTGNEVETNIQIKELFLSNPKENEDIYYSVEFINGLAQSAPMQSNTAFNSTQPVAPAPQISLPEPLEEESIQPTEETLIQSPSYNNDFEEQAPLNLDESSKETISFKKDDSNEPLKIQPLPQDDFMQDYKEESLHIDEKEDFTEDYQDTKLKLDIQDEEEHQETKLKLDIQDEEEDQKVTFTEPVVTTANNDDMAIRLKEDFDTNPIVQQDPKEDEEEDLDFDILKCVEELGLDISLVSELLTDYVEKLTKTLPLLKLNIDTNDQASLEKNIYKLKGISDHLHVNQISNKLTAIFEATDKEKQEREVEKLEKIVTEFKGKLL